MNIVLGHRAPRRGWSVSCVHGDLGSMSGARGVFDWSRSTWLPTPWSSLIFTRSHSHSRTLTPVERLQLLARIKEG